MVAWLLITHGIYLRDDEGLRSLDNTQENDGKELEVHVQERRGGGPGRTGGGGGK